MSSDEETHQATAPVLPLTVSDPAGPRPSGGRRKALPLCAVAIAAASLGALLRGRSSIPEPGGRPSEIGAAAPGAEDHHRALGVDDADDAAPVAATESSVGPGDDPPADGSDDPYGQGVSLIAMQIAADPYETEDKMELVLRGGMALVGVSLLPRSLAGGGGGGYSDVKASFCDLKDAYDKQKVDPSVLPMFRDVMGISDHCSDHLYTLDLKEVVAAARARDAAPNSDARSAEPAAFLFHERGSGSTLLANSLAVADPDRSRVISEHSSVAEVLNYCDKSSNRYGVEDCDRAEQVELFRDVVYMLGRTRNPDEDRLYIKVQESATVNMDIAIEAFPQAKWSFNYRNADSALEKDTQRRRSLCARNRNSPSKALKAYVADLGQDLKDMSDLEVCSAYLSTVVSTAMAEYDATGTGLLIDYDTELLTGEALLDDILSNYFDIQGLEKKDGEKRMRIKDQMGKHALRRHEDKPWNGVDEGLTKRISPEVSAANVKYLNKAMDKIAKKGGGGR